MKIIAVAFAVLFFCLKANAQTSTQPDSTVTIFKAYLEKKTRYPAVAAENDIQGPLVVEFSVNHAHLIEGIKIIKPLFPDCDSAVVKAIRNYAGKLSIPPNDYTVGFQFIIYQAEKPDVKIIPFDKGLYKNFLLELSLIRYAPKLKKEIVY